MFQSHLQQSVFKLDVSICNTPLVAVICTDNELLEEPPCHSLLLSQLSFDMLKKVQARITG
jgi:hypothetical protein